MNTSTADLAITHLDRLLAVAQDVRDSYLAITRHEYYPLIAGNFLVEFTDARKVTQFEWDGVEGRLAIRERRISHCTVAMWAEISHEPLDYLPDEPYATMRTYLLEAIERG